MAVWWKELLFWTWCLPQTILGLILITVVKLCGGIIDIERFRGVTLVHTHNSKALGGIALGKFNFVTDRCWRDNDTIYHEYGHTLQSFFLGPFYLIIVGVPSIFWLALSHFSPYIKATYRNRYPESWADRLMNLNPDGTTKGR